MRILVVDDDELQAKQIAAILQDQFSSEREELKVDIIPTEHEFMSFTRDVTAQRPVLIVLDKMLRWTNPAPEMPPPPPDHGKDAFFEAGVRCYERLQQDPRLRSIPVILYTILGRGTLAGSLTDDLPAYVACISKEASFQNLKETAQRLVKQTREPSPC